MNFPVVAPSSIDIRLFAAMPGNNALLLPDTPNFTIVAVTDGYAQTSGRAKEEFIGKGLFDVFPHAEDDHHVTSDKQLLASLEHALFKKEPHRLALHRYDIPTAVGTFDERYWSAVNTPVLNEKGEVIYIIHTGEDVTLQIKAAQQEATVRGVEKAFNLFMHAPFVVGLVSGENHVLELANETAFKLWGKGPDIIGKPLLEVIPEVNGQGIIELLEQVKRTGQPYISKATPVVSLEGGKKKINYFDLVYQPYYETGSDTPTGVFTISHDVTEQVIAQKQIEESEKRFRALVTATSNFVYRLSADGSEMSQLPGRGLLSDAGKPVANWLQKYIPSNEQQRVMAAIKKASESKTIFELEHQFIKKDGSVGWISSRAIPILDDNGKIIEWFGTAHDITEVRRAEKALAEAHKRIVDILESTTDAFYALDANFNFTYINKRAAQLWGRDRESLLGRHYWTEFPNAVGSPSYHKHYEVLKEGTPVHYETVSPLLGFWIDASIYPNREGGLSVFFRDITERKQAEEELERKVRERTLALEKTNQELERSNQNLEEFAYAASHDLKEPIRKIHLFSDRLKQELKHSLNENQLLLFDRMERATQRMALLIDDLLTYSHVSRSAFQLETVDLNQKVRNVLDDLELAIEEKAAVIKVEPLPSIKGHRRQLQQLFQNLIGNALKYNKPGMAPEIHIRSAVVSGREVPLVLPAEEAEKQFYLVEIKDNGIGFPQEDAERIFNMFTRLHGNAEYKGTGVGLSIVKKVVQNHGGYIWATSSPGEGASFKVLFPTA